MKTKSILTITLTGICLLATAAFTPVYGADATIVFGANRNPAALIRPAALAIAVKEFSFGGENTTSIASASSGAGAGKAKLNSLVIKKSVDGASPILFQAMGMGTSYDDVTLSVRKPGTSGPAFYVLKFTMVFVTKINITGSGDELPMEEITLTYGAVQETLATTDPAGGAAGKPITGGWDQVNNKAPATGP